MFDPVGTPMKRGLVGCALDPFDLWQPVVRFNVPKETFFICGNEIAWVMENFFDDNGTEVKSSSIENYTFTENREVHIRTWYIVPSGGPLGEQMQQYLPEGGPELISAASVPPKLERVSVLRVQLGRDAPRKDRHRHRRRRGPRP